MKNKMSVQTAIEKITYVTSNFPEEPFRILSENPQEAIPYLMEGIKKALTEQDRLDVNYQLHFYALFLLAEFGYQEAFPTVMELISIPANTLDTLLGGAITEGLDDCLYSLYNGDIDLLESYIIETQSNSYAKNAALRVYIQLYNDGEIQQQRLMDLFKKLIYAPVVEDDTFDTMVSAAVCDCRLFSMLPDVKYMYDYDRVDESYYGDYADCVDSIFNYGPYRERGLNKINSAADMLRNWAMFDQPTDSKSKKDATKKDFEKMLNKMIASAQQPVKTEKIYPNDPCPCGSGKKYKKCCMNKAADKKEELTMAADRKKWLESYPEDPGCRIEGHIYLSDFYDREAIETDKLVYLELKHRAEFITMRETQEQKIKRRTYYLLKAFSRYAERCKAEDIRTFREYDDKYSIHYTSAEWLNYLIQLLEEQKLSAELKEVKSFCAGR